MKTLTDKEMELMQILWNKGSLGMRELYENLPEPRSHFNTISTMVKHHAVSLKVYLYEAAVTLDEYQHYAQRDLVDKAFGGSYMGFISKLVEEEEISIGELRELIELIEKK